MIAVLARLRDIEEWINQGWTAGSIGLRTGVQRAYGTFYVYRKD